MKLFSVLTLAAVLAMPIVARAQLNYRVSLDTSSLIGNPAGPFSLDFQFNDGSALGDGNNSATLTNFRFGGGSAVGVATTFGGATGDLGSTVWLTDSQPLFNEFFQAFTPGAWLSFDLTLTTYPESGYTPDIFSFALLDGNLMNVPTHSLGSDSFLEINLTGSTPSIATFGSLNNVIAAPSISAVPEPATYGLWLSIGLGGVILARRNSRRRVE